LNELFHFCRAYQIRIIPIFVKNLKKEIYRLEIWGGG